MAEEVEYFEMDCGCKFPILGDKKESDGLPAIEIDYYNINLDCPITWDLIREGDTLGVFQLDSNVGQKWAAKVRPDNITEVADLSGLLRPGAAEAMLDGVSMSEHYVLRKFGKEENKSKFKPLENILARTYNVLLYQEQIIKIAKEIAGFDLVEGDNLRKAVGSKLAEKLKKVGEKFVDKAEEKGVVTRKEAEEIFGWIYESSRYLFNEIHSYEYAYVGYFTAYAKAHFPQRFSQSYLTYSTDTPKKKKREVVKDIIQDGKKRGLYIRPPSFLNLFRCNGQDCMVKGKLYYGLGNIKGVGNAALTKLQECIEDFKEVEDVTWNDILFYVSTKVNKTCIESLIKSGCLSHLDISRKRALFHFNKFKSLTSSVQKWCTENYAELGGDFPEILEEMINRDECKTKNTRKKVEETLDSLRNPPYNLEEDVDYNMRHERELLGICLTVDVKDVIDTSICNENCESAKQSRRKDMVIPCMIQTAKFFKIKRGNNIGKEMCSLKFSDDFGEVDAVIWSDVLEECENIIFEGNTVIVFAEPSNRRGQVKVNKLCQA